MNINKIMRVVEIRNRRVRVAKKLEQVDEELRSAKENLTFDELNRYSEILMKGAGKLRKIKNVN